MRLTIHLVSARDWWPFAVATREARRRSWLRYPGTRMRARPPPPRASSAADRGRADAAARNRGGGRPRAQRDLRRRLLARHGPGAAVRHLGAAAGGPLRGRRGLARPREVAADDALDHAGSSYLRGFGPAARRDDRRLPRPRAAGSSTAARADEAAPFPGRGRRGAARPAARAAAGPRHPRAGSLSAHVGRHAARARAANRDPARAVPPAGIRHEDAAVRRDLPGRRRGRRDVALREGAHQG